MSVQVGHQVGVHGQGWFESWKIWKNLKIWVMGDHEPEFSTGRMDRVGSGRVTILPDFGGSGRVSIICFQLIISWYLNEFSNTTFGLIDFHWYLIYNNYLINK